jgi:hypothetical protein
LIRRRFHRQAHATAPLARAGTSTRRRSPRTGFWICLR